MEMRKAQGPNDCSRFTCCFVSLFFAAFILTIIFLTTGHTISGREVLLECVFLFLLGHHRRFHNSIFAI